MKRRVCRVQGPQKPPANSKRTNPLLSITTKALKRHIGGDNQAYQPRLPTLWWKQNLEKNCFLSVALRRMLCRQRRHNSESRRGDRHNQIYKSSAAKPKKVNCYQSATSALCSEKTPHEDKQKPDKTAVTNFCMRLKCSRPCRRTSERPAVQQCKCAELV